MDAQAPALAEIIRAVAAGDGAAYETLYLRTSAKLFSVCLRISSDRHDAEEALQETYLSVWRRAASYDEARGSAMTWLITLARNRAVDRLRAGKPSFAAMTGQAEAIADTRPDALDHMEQMEQQHRLAACLDQLEATDSRFIRTSFLAGATYSELAETAMMPLSTVKSRIRRALLKLRECLR